MPAQTPGSATGVVCFPIITQGLPRQQGRTRLSAIERDQLWEASGMAGNSTYSQFVSDHLSQILTLPANRFKLGEWEGIMKDESYTMSGTLTMTLANHLDKFKVVWSGIFETSRTQQSRRLNILQKKSPNPDQT